MGSIKKNSESFKAKVAIAPIKGGYTVVELCKQFGVALSQIFKWKKQLLKGASNILLPMALKQALMRIIATSSIRKQVVYRQKIPFLKKVLTLNVKA